MPIVVNPGFAWPPETDPVVSPDGRLTAIVDPAHAGVLLRADYSDQLGRTEDVVLATNRVTNPSFEHDESSWSVAGGTALFTSSFHDRMWSASGSGARLAQIAADGASSYMTLDYRGQRIPVAPGQWVGVAMLVANDDSEDGFAGVRSDLVAYGDTTVYLATEGFTKARFYSGRRITYAVQMPAGATEARIRVQMYSGSSAPIPAGTRMWVDDAIGCVAESEAEALAAVATYFDGDTTDSADPNEPHYRWNPDGTSEKYLPAHNPIQNIAKVRFERQDGSVVRSGNPAWAPGGYAHAYDHEATLGGGTLWRAVPIRFDGTEGEPSEYVGAVIPALSDGWAWLKPVTDPDKAMLLKVEPPDLSYDGRVDTTSIAGAPRPAATWDVLEGFTTQLRSLVREKNVEQQLMALLDEGPVLAQFPACAGLPDFYFIRGKLDLEHVHWDGWPWRRYQWEVIQIDRPDTTDSPLRIPGLSYDTVARDWTTYDQLKSTVESYNKLLEP